MISPPLLARESDEVLLIEVTDVTEWHWETTRMGRNETKGHPGEPGRLP
ncbi:hypothetical protein [Mycolicibacterium hodleri]|nr:hypothetical protein [Mycolicibacterium hodleri]